MAEYIKHSLYLIVAIGTFFISEKVPEPYDFSTKISCDHCSYSNSLLKVKENITTNFFKISNPFNLRDAENHLYPKRISYQIHLHSNERLIGSIQSQAPPFV